MTDLKTSNTQLDDFHYMCRACLRKPEKAMLLSAKQNITFHSIFDHPENEKYLNLSIIELFNYTTPQVLIKKDDGFPTYVCSFCVKQLQQIYDFQQMCIQSQNQIKEMFEFRMIPITPVIVSADLEVFRSPMIGTELEDPLDDKFKQIVKAETIGADEKLKLSSNYMIGSGCISKEELEKIKTVPIDEVLETEIYLNDVENEDREIVHMEGKEIEKDFGKNNETAISEASSRSPFTENVWEIYKESSMIVDKKTIPAENDLVEPAIENGKGVNKLACHICKKKFRAIFHLERHMKIHNKDREYNCIKCLQNFESLRNLKLHERKAHNEEFAEKTANSIFQCNKCELIFTCENALRTHMTLHNNAITNSEEMAKTLKYSCSQCGLYFKTTHMLCNHKRIHRKPRVKSVQEINKKKDDLKPYICTYCNKGFQQSCTLKEHIRTHTGEQPYLCSECGKAFKSSSNMKQHLLRHTGILRYECPDCPKKFPCLSDLASHKAVHKKLKPHICVTCGAAFGKPFQLKKHNMYHNGDKPYKCEYCEMRFVCGDHMRRHMRTHTGEKPYKCRYCERAFAQSNDMIKHLRCHLGENVYKCELCPMGFRLAAELRAHFANHKNDSEEMRMKNLEALREEEAKLHIKLAGSASKSEPLQSQLILSNNPVKTSLKELTKNNETNVNDINNTNTEECGPSLIIFQ